jgi:hypothetical protein
MIGATDFSGFAKGFSDGGSLLICCLQKERDEKGFPTLGCFGRTSSNV